MLKSNNPRYIQATAFPTLYMKKISILIAGSRGDIEPFIALSKELAPRGYEVQLVAHADFMPLADKYGINIAPIRLSSKDFTAPLMDPPEMNPFTMVRLLRGILEPLLQSILPDVWKHTRDSDAIISTGTSLWGLDVAEKLQVPHILVGLQPLLPTEEFPHVSVSDLPQLGGLINKFSYAFINYSCWQAISRSINEWRVEQLKLPKKIGNFTESDVWKNQLHLAAYSPLVVPQPLDWTKNATTTGYWRLPASGYQPPSQLSRFLESSQEKPIYIGFGSMLYADVKRVASMVVSALRQSRRRGIISFEEKHLEGIPLSSNVINVGFVPHDWLFPQLAAVICHGGAGTTAAALTAGIPSMAIEFFGDQLFWGQRIYELGVGLPPIKKKQLSTDKFVRAIEALTSSQNLKTQAMQLGDKLRKENGAEKAARLIDQYVKESCEVKLPSDPQMLV